MAGRQGSLARVQEKAVGKAVQHGAEEVQAAGARWDASRSTHYSSSTDSAYSPSANDAIAFSCATATLRINILARIRPHKLGMPPLVGGGTVEVDCPS